ncbi:Crp/Fnr family transcriptional regulator [Alteromonas sp. CI.11.F.A3]|uniref:Crp/Fnr family transcriptional regulator n=1 Tax=Alteromonas sp. CI.11.F.A3 TaxID=3079555 RepID=UPI002943C9B9|nr:Crp/Fnr family transcriptional regulator [Alteromonas sp. CI.11.F.A3]WOI38161.1 Crp/Fnr family transcriptional regulator [Alteromonas sp. CI.11.F.A3]
MSYIKALNQIIMPESLLALCTQFGAPTEYVKGAMIHNRGDLKPGLSIVEAGQVKVGNYGLDGNYQLTTVLERGDTFGEFTLYASLARTHHAQAMSDCTVLQINESRFRQLEDAHPKVGVFLTRNLAIKLHATLERLDDILRLPTHVQLAKLIYQTNVAQANSAQNSAAAVQLRQSDYAERLGVTVLTAHKALNKLVSLSLIRKQYGKVEIIDKAVMSKWLSDNMSLLPV